MSRATEIYGENYTMAEVCKGCDEHERGYKYRCANCLDGSEDEFVPPSALERGAVKP